MMLTNCCRSRQASCRRRAAAAAAAASTTLPTLPPHCLPLPHCCQHAATALPLPPLHCHRRQHAVGATVLLNVSELFGIATLPFFFSLLIQQR
jgi:hypothetical protein